MMYESDLIKIISDATGVKCFLDVVPEKASLPSCAITSIGTSPVNTRDLSGSKVGHGREYRVSLVASSMDSLNLLVNRMELLDNTTHSNFQRIMTDFSSREPYTGNERVFRVFYNLTAIK